MLTFGVFVDGKCDTIYGIHTDPSWASHPILDGIFPHKPSIIGISIFMETPI